MGIKSDVAQSKQERKEDAKLLKNQLTLQELKEDTSELRKAIEKTTVANQEMMNEKIAEINQKFDELLKTERSGKYRKRLVYWPTILCNRAVFN